jgi:hypothetical protein
MRQAQKYDSSDVQGEGSYVVMWRRTHKQAKEQRDAATIDDARLEEMLAEAVVDWNWTDASGVALTLPAADPAVFDDMPENELAFLLRVFLGQIDVKN